MLCVSRFVHAALLPGYSLHCGSWYSRLIAFVYIVLIGVLACLSACLHALVHMGSCIARVGIYWKEDKVFPGNPEAECIFCMHVIVCVHTLYEKCMWYFLQTQCISLFLCVCMCVCVCLCVCDVVCV